MIHAAKLLCKEDKPDAAIDAWRVLHNQERKIVDCPTLKERLCVTPLKFWTFDQSVLSKIERLLAEMGIPNARAIASLTQPSFRLRPTEGNLSNIPLGGSRFGGCPDVPESFEWPVNKGLPLTFLAQINLSHLGSTPLPPQGWLLFFFDEVAFPIGLSDDDRFGFRVLYVASDSESLLRRPHPTLAEGHQPYPGRPISTQIVASLPDTEDFIGTREFDGWRGTLNSTKLFEGYGDLKDALLTGSEAALLTGIAEDEHSTHLLFGHPKLVQSDMRESEVQYPFPPLNITEASDSHRRPYKPKPEDWQLLLQLDSDEQYMNWCWGDAGMLYFWITKDDLAEQRFDRCWMVFQCY